MTQPQALVNVQFPRDPAHFEALDRLENDITQLSAHIAAATYRLLKLLGDYDEREGWARHGLASCAHWMQWQCGTSLGAAREKVRVARALPQLPLISQAFREGRISYSKTRAMTRVATPRNEDNLLNIAMHGTAAHVETVVRDYRRTKRLEALQQENLRHSRRELSWRIDENGMWLLKGVFTAEQGALIHKALEKSLEQQFLEQRDEPEQGKSEQALSATEQAEGSKDYDLPCPINTRRADAMERIAESFLAGETRSSSGGDRYLIHLHTEAEVLKNDGEGAVSACEDGCDVSAETSRRMACDASVVQWHESNGEPLSVGRKTRSIPPAIRRALMRRDGGCRFPGCSCTRFVDAHHIRHWADGGETRLSNLVLLCRRHHRLVHEGGFGVHLARSGEIWFSYPTGEPLPDHADGRFRGNVSQLELENRQSGLDITERTLPPNWRGERMDRHLAVLGLVCRE